MTHPRARNEGGARAMNERVAEIRRYLTTPGNAGHVDPVRLALLIYHLETRDELMLDESEAERE